MRGEPQRHHGHMHACSQPHLCLLQEDKVTFSVVNIQTNAMPKMAADFILQVVSDLYTVNLDQYAVVGRNHPRQEEYIRPPKCGFHRW